MVFTRRAKPLSPSSLLFALFTLVVQIGALVGVTAFKSILGISPPRDIDG